MPTLTSERQAVFLAAYEKSGRKSASARAAGVLPQRFSEWIKEPEFAARFAEATDKARERLLARAKAMGIAEGGRALRVLIGQGAGRIRRRRKESL